MKKLFVLVIFLLSLNFAEASNTNDTVSNITDTKSSVLLDAQVDCGSLEGGISSENSENTALKCCKVCKKGKACGDSCIAKSKTCTKGPGCACNGY